MRNWKSLLTFLVITLAAAMTGTISAPDAWFSALQKPSFNPPTWVFPPVWSVLYAMMAIAAWRVYRVTGVGAAIGLWFAQLLINAAWTPLFFGARQPVWALVDLVVLFVAAGITAIRFLPLDRRASLLLLPYLAWLGFALALNGAIVAMN